MFETDPLAVATLATDAVQVTLQAGPPTDLPGPVPEFVGDILGAVGSAMGDAAEGLGETISNLTPGGGAENAPSDAAGSAPGR